MLGLYLLIGVGVYLGLAAQRFSEIKDATIRSAILGLVLTIISWPYALYNNFDYVKRAINDSKSPR